MPNTVAFNKFTETVGARADSTSLLARVWNFMMRAAEARAIFRIEQEAGHLLSVEQIRDMKREFARRHKL